MNATQLLAHFDRLAEAPNAVPRLRRFILDLAVRGKLVAQDAGDEPAAKLLKRIHTSRTATKKSLAGNLTKVLDVESFNAGYGLPSSWQWEELGNLVARMDAGWSPQCESYPRRELEMWGVLKTTAVQPLAFDCSQHKELPEKFKPRPGYEAQVGDILVTRAGPKNRVGVSCVVDKTEPRLMISDKLIRFHLLGDLDPFFCALALNAGYSNQCVEDAKSGMAVMQMNISQDRLKMVPLPIPPLAEQHRIVAKVDELMALCDQLEAAQQERERRRDRLSTASLQRLNQPAPETTPEAQREHARFHLQNLPCLTTRPQHTKAVRQAIFSLAIEGRLIPQCGSDVRASTALTQLGVATEVIVSSTAALPETWSCVPFDQVAAVTGGVTLGRKLSGKKTIDLPYLRVANVKRGELDLSVLKVVTIGETELDRYALKTNDLLLTEGGDWDKVGRAAIWRNEVPVCLHQNHIFRARLRTSELSARWFELYFNAPAGRAYFENSSKQTTNLASINMRQVRACPVPLPPLSEQHRIVAKVDELMALCDQLEAQLTTTQTDSRRLLEAVLEAALAPA